MGNKLFNIRGTNGTGKSTIMRNYIGDDYKTILFRTSCNRDVKVLNTGNKYVLGDYPTDCGGIDLIRTLPEVRECVMHFIELGDVFMEGMMYSTIYSTPASIDDDITALGHEYYWVHIDIPVEDCIDCTVERRVRNGKFKDFDPKLLVQKWRSIGTTFNKAVNDKRLAFSGDRQSCKESIDSALMGDKSMFQRETKVNNDIDISKHPVIVVTEDMIQKFHIPKVKPLTENIFDFM